MKLNPVNDYLLPIFKQVFEPFISRGYMIVSEGDMEASKYLNWYLLLSCRSTSPVPSLANNASQSSVYSDESADGNPPVAGGAIMAEEEDEARPERCAGQAGGLLRPEVQPDRPHPGGDGQPLHVPGRGHRGRALRIRHRQPR